MKTFGNLRWTPGTEGRAKWILEPVPHVAIRLKRIFPRIRVESRGMLFLADTIETARELEWVMQMYPMVMDEPVATHLARRAEAYRERAQAIDNILGGNGRQATLELTDPGMTPRPYQTEFVALLAQVNRILLGDETGVGKTITSALGFALPGALPALVAMPTHLPAQWTTRMFELWPMLRCYTLRGTKPYDLRAARGTGGHYPDILLAPYSRLAGWAPALAGQVRTVVFDEVQELRNGIGTDKGQGAARLSDKAIYVVGQSATPAHNYGDEFWNILDIINPDALGTREEFLREWCAGGRVLDPKGFGTYLRDAGFMIARTRKDVGQQLPQKPVVEVETVGSDAAAIAEVKAEISQLASLILSPSTSSEDRFLMGGQLDLKLRMATGTAKAPFVAEYVRLLLESESKVVLYGWHRDVYDIWLERLEEFRPVMFTGSESPTQKDESRRRFVLPNEDPESSRVLIISLASGSGLDGLQLVCSTVVFGELDWSPKRHTQAVDRIDRPGQESPVLVVYLVADDGSDPVISEVLDLKAQNTDPIMDPDAAMFELRPDAESGKTRTRGLAEAWLGKHDPKALELAQVGASDV